MLDSTSDKMWMLDSGLAEHDKDCCTADSPCDLRTGMTIYRRHLVTSKPELQVSAIGRVTTAARKGTQTMTTNRPAARMASEAQLSFLVNLGATHEVTDRQSEQLLNAEVLTMRQASELITSLKNQPFKSRPATGRSIVEISDGMYTKDGKVYKVQVAVHGSGRLYAKELIEGEDGERYFEMAPGMVRRLTVDNRMTKEEAQEFGRLYGVCVCCGATLTDEASIKRGLGPVCATKF
jgi:uncharacterized protein with FMN-binding domain